MLVLRYTQQKILTLYDGHLGFVCKEVGLAPSYHIKWIPYPKKLISGY